MKGPAMKGLGYIKRPATEGTDTKQCGRDILLRETSEVSFYLWDKISEPLMFMENPPK
jgi:hypothetical protein